MEATDTTRKQMKKIPADRVERKEEEGWEVRKFVCVGKRAKPVIAMGKAPAGQGEDTRESIHFRSKTPGELVSKES